LTLVNASSEHKTPQMWSHKWCRMFAEVRSNFGRIFTCCRAEPSQTFGRTSASAELQPISTSHVFAQTTHCATSATVVLGWGPGCS